MTVYGATDPKVIGQPISPFFGAQNGIAYAGAPVIPLPAAGGSGPVKSVNELVSNGSIPANALVNTVNGQSVGGPTGVIGADPCSVAELLSSGNGNQSNLGVASGALPGQPGENQQYVVGLTANASLSNGPAAENTDPIGIAPVQGNIAASSVVLVPSGFGG